MEGHVAQNITFHTFVEQRAQREKKNDFAYVSARSAEKNLVIFKVKKKIKTCVCSIVS